MITKEHLKSFEPFQNVPIEQLDWLVNKGETLSKKVGEFIFKSGEPADHMLIMMSGKVRIYTFQNNRRKDFGTFEGPYMTGVLPFSRMEKAAGNGELVEDSTILFIHRMHFPDLVSENYELAAALVQFMTSRVRTFTSSRLQEEKMMSLGKLSAGLAHELNNPAAAVVRSSSELKKHLKLLPEGFKQVMLIEMTPEQVDEVNEILFNKISGFEPIEVSLMERTEREDDLADWLEENGVEDAYEIAPELVEFCFDQDDLEQILKATGENSFETVMKWVVNNLTTEKMVTDIEEASTRISELVGSIKSYTHMDKAQDMQAIDLRKGLKNTLNILQHKMRKNKIQLEDQGLVDTPKVKALPGQINQVFTNIIDNALDAMSDGGKLTLISDFDDETVWIEIIDNGPGIPEELKDKIFDPFFTTKDVGQGTGMGLEVVQKILQSHRARLDLDSEPGKTNFKLIFPRA